MVFFIRVLVAIGMVFFALRVVQRLRMLASQGRGIPRGPSGQPSRRPFGFPPMHPIPERPKVLAFSRSPHQILGVDEDASMEEIEAVYQSLSAENDPENAKDLSPEVRELVTRRRAEIDEAYASITSDAD